jgi:hypothetical protein
MEDKVVTIMDFSVIDFYPEKYKSQIEDTIHVAIKYLRHVEKKHRESGEGPSGEDALKEMLSQGAIPLSAFSSLRKLVKDINAEYTITLKQ